MTPIESKRQAMRILILLKDICASSTSKQEALSQIASGVRSLDGRIYDVAESMMYLPEYKALPNVKELQ